MKALTVPTGARMAVAYARYDPYSNHLTYRPPRKGKEVLNWGYITLII
jgi:hypothetical protein